MTTTPSSALPAAATAEGDPRTAQMVRTARQFEAILINSLFGSLEKTFASLPGQPDEQVGAEDYHYLGMQALSSRISGSGGIGIADMIIRQLQKNGFVHENSPTKDVVLEGLS